MQRRLGKMGELTKTGNPTYLELLQRLSHDPRMHKVWRTIYRRRKAEGSDTSEFFYPTIPQILFASELLQEFDGQSFMFFLRADDPYPDETLWLRDALFGRDRDWEIRKFCLEHSRKTYEQDYAASVLIAYVFYFAFRKIRTMTFAEAEALRARLIEVGSQLEALSCDPRLGYSGSQIWQLKNLAADAYVRADNPLPQSPLIIVRHREDPHVKGLAIVLVLINVRLFGNPFHDAVATLVNVAIPGTKVTGGAVQQMVRGALKAGSAARASLALNHANSILKTK